MPFNTQGLCKLVLGPDPGDKTSGASRPLNKLLAGYRSGVDVESTGDWSIIQLARKLRSCRDCEGRKREQAAHRESTRNLRRPAPQKCLIAGVPFLFAPLYPTHPISLPFSIPPAPLSMPERAVLLNPSNRRSHSNFDVFFCLLVTISHKLYTLLHG